LLIALAILCVFGSDPAVTQGRQRVVNVYNWSDYIDPTVIDDFTKNSGIAVRYDTFDSNDTLETKLLAGKSGYDVVAPTAYFLRRHFCGGAALSRSRSQHDQGGRLSEGCRPVDEDQGLRAQVLLLRISQRACLRRGVLRGWVFRRHQAGAKARGGNQERRRDR